MEQLEVSCTVTPAEIDGFDGFLLEFNELHQQLRIAREERAARPDRGEPRC